jgi:hypothetical protein
MTTDDDRLRRKIKTNAIILGFVAFGFFIAFIAFTAIVRG